MTERQKKVEFDYRKKLITKYGTKEAAYRLGMSYGGLRYWMYMNGLKVRDIKISRLPLDVRTEMFNHEVELLREKYNLGAEE